ncbi:hypothetical protein C8Q79DRAFT_898483 [Trametes meyenii]|nr:hypothetical protein C8Q79DRAFT_898483 [Trametes meyenii]
MSPYWQIRQVVTIDQEWHIDRCNVFGGRGSLRIWSAFESLVSWIATNKAGVSDDRGNYVDDDFGFAVLGDVEWYAPYQRYFPTPQVRLLHLWDELGVPHEPAKQVHDTRLPIISFLVDPNAMTVTLTDEGREHLIQAIDDFLGSRKGNRRRPLSAFQAFAGYANWAFNVYLLLKPALANIYDKMAGKTERHAGIFVNTAIVRDLQWLRNHVIAATGVRLLDATVWFPADLVEGSPTDEFALTDASGWGLGVYFPWLKLGLLCERPTRAPSGTIFFFEALAICAAIHRARAWQRAGRFVHRLGILSDNSNSVAIFNSLRASPPYNPILKSAVDVMLEVDLDVRVDHIPGELNIVADALSRNNVALVHHLVPGITVLPLTPPRDALGAAST